jgi:hypothetical protein
MAQALRLPNLVGRRRSRQDQESDLRQWSGVKSLQSPAWLKEIYDRISTLEKLEENWDSYGGLPVAAAAISRVRVLLSNLDIEDMPTPHVAPLPDGGVGLQWRVAGRDLEIEIEPNGETHYLQTKVGTESVAGDVRSLSQAQSALDWVLGRTI